MYNDQVFPVAIVTGGSRGIGAEIVKKLADNNFTVILNYFHSEDRAKEIASIYPNSVHIYKADVSKYNEVRNLVDFAIQKFGRIDLLVNNAGIDLIKTITDTTTAEFDYIIRTNLYSAFYASKEVSKYMVKNKSGLIVNISSIWGLVGASCEVAYSISKAGLDGLTKSLAKELGPSNIRVNSIAPGIIDTDMNNNLSIADKKAIIDEVPLGKIGSKSDIADCIIYLFNAQYITGQIIQVNGGWNI